MPCMKKRGRDLQVAKGHSIVPYPAVDSVDIALCLAIHPFCGLLMQTTEMMVIVSI
ncbi:hypothetical protein DAPPUDRAFT_236020 [Daphnia pulex]|uniref:Uncharacterized protein n=1 Tax=Daphnia pulex TaxID=6669 RepID=E9FZQ1_DAPPU|nr:hypothetical protein DAPPUDRAFT_236020 [Daphnia pulex]|eukprot:EFX87096.1 hypothetical protein DAPPUDRAFT_236020 [Daphnia pulex]